MPTRLKILALAATLAAGAQSAALAQYVCPPGYAYAGGVCQPMGSPGYSNPVSGAVAGEAAGAASGYRAAGRPDPFRRMARARPPASMPDGGGARDYLRSEIWPC